MRLQEYKIKNRLFLLTEVVFISLLLLLASPFFPGEVLAQSCTGSGYACGMEGATCVPDFCSPTQCDNNIGSCHWEYSCENPDIATFECSGLSESECSSPTCNPITYPCGLEENLCSWTSDSPDPPTPTPTPPPGEMWCGDCSAGTCMIGTPDECSAVGDSDGDGACENCGPPPDPSTTWINGAIVDYSSNRYIGEDVDTCIGSGITLTPSSGSVGWKCDAQGGHYDASIGTGTQTLTLDPTPASFTNCDYQVFTRDCSDLNSVAYDPVVSDSCSATFDVPGNCDWEKGVNFWMKDPSTTCTVAFDNSPYSIPAGSSTTAYVSVSTTPPDQPVDQVTFTSGDANIFTVCNPLNTPCPDGVVAYTDSTVVDGDAESGLTGKNPGGPVAITASATLEDGTICSNIAVAPVTVTNRSPWLQTERGDVVAGSGDIVSTIPDSCDPTITSCVPELILSDIDNGEYPGVAIAGGSVSTGDGVVSETNWKAEGSVYQGTIYDYEFFDRKVPASVTRGDAFAFATDSPPDTYQGYEVYEINSNYIIGPSGGKDFGNRKIILFVNGDLTIEDEMNLNDGIGFFMAIVSGDIEIDASLGTPISSLPDPSAEPNLEGVYIANSQFITGSIGAEADTLQLRVRGTVAGWGHDGTDYGQISGVSLDRDLTNNATIPGELFEYAPDIIFNYPRFFSKRSVEWKEVAP